MDHGDAHATDLAEAWECRSRSLWKQAESLCRSVLSHDPDCGQAWHLLGLLANDQNQKSQAAQYLKQAIAVEPGQPAHYNNLGVVLNSMDRHAEAESYLLKALEISPQYHDARCNLGLALYHQKQLNQAADCFKQILSAIPNHDAALANLGMTRLAQQRYADAADAYEKAVSLSPDQAQWHGNLGAAYIRMGQYEKAAECYRSASAIDAATLEYGISRGIALRAAGNLSESIRLLEGVLGKDPGRASAIAQLVVGLEYTCQWNKLEIYHPLLDHATKAALKNGCRPHEDPMLNIRRCDDVTVNRAVGRAWSLHHQNKARRTGLRIFHGSDRRHREKISIGYLSYDFRNHPVAHQLFPLFGLHHRNRFRTVVFSMGPDDGSLFRKQIEAGCDEFVDIGSLGLAEAAQAISDRQIDILVDLMGHSHHNRMEILALRPAPIQVGYLGFLSTTGAPFIDYLVADATVVPKDHESCFDEKLLRMPHCYQFCHNQLISAQAEMNRTDMNRKDSGLPETGFVFCCFNTVYKINREVFDAWMRILLQVPGSVLWLNGGHPMARQQMQSRAAMLGIDPHRLIFAEKIALEEHLKRLPLADLALDTIRYNGGATTANALGCGVPVITVMGRHWVSRMAASHLIAAGFPELVFPSMAAYERAAVELALQDGKLRTLKQRLEKNIETSPLFDSRGFVRQLECGFDIIWQRFRDGLAPDHIDVPEVPLQTKDEGTSRSQVGGVKCNIDRHPVNRIHVESKRLEVANHAAAKAQHTIYYCCPQVSIASAGIRRLYRHVSILHGAGLPVYLMFENQEYRPANLPGVPVAENDLVANDKTAIFVIPEGMPRIMHQLKDHPGRRFAIALSWCYVYGALPDGLDWRHLNIERVLTVSPAIARMVNWSMGLPVHLLDSSIDHERYFIDPGSKKKQIAFIQRKGDHDLKLQSLLASRKQDYIHQIKWIGLEGLHQEEYAAQIRASAIFLSTSMAEGFPTSCLEAMAAGALVCGYDGIGSKDILRTEGQRPNGLIAGNGDYVTLAYRMAPLLDDLIQDRMDRWAPIISNARRTASKYTAENEAASVIAFWKPFIYDEPACHPENPTNRENTSAPFRPMMQQEGLIQESGYS